MMQRSKTAITGELTKWQRPFDRITPLQPTYTLNVVMGGYGREPELVVSIDNLLTQHSWYIFFQGRFRPR